ncbi:MAG TPA: hypothetical protein VFZ65_08610 [Planctomycetota bacterium]|nr:hypothetical protein [Planctomycetota bacterium]
MAPRVADFNDDVVLVALGPSASWALSLPGWLDPGTPYFQGVHFDATNSLICTTQRLNVPLVK